jgi:TolA-binding protein
VPPARRESRSLDPRGPELPRSEPVQHAPAPPRRAQPPAEAQPELESAQSLFRRANRLRSVDWSAAAALYSELIKRYPSSNEAGVSEVALGKWSLAQGRSGDALEWFRAHLRRPPGALTAEALFGEARALESIGSHTAAQAPWRQLLERYPASPYADAARRRLAP